MKEKIILLLIICLFATGLVFAAGSESGGQPDTNGQPETAGQPEETGNPEENGNGTQETQETQNQGENDQIQTQNQVQSGNYITEAGKQVQVQTQSNNMIQLKTGTATAQTTMQMTQEQTQTGTKLQVKLSNGQNAEIKIMPDVASEKAIERLKLKTCTAEEGCSIELKETGSGEQLKATYEIKTQKESRVLGLFKAKVQLQAHIDAESGEVIQTQKSWWSFLATA